MAGAYVRWGRSRPFDMGGTIRSALAELAAGRKPETHESQPNGALMRAAPIGIACSGRPEEAAAVARLDAALTHPHPRCLSANAAFCAAIAVGVAGGSRSEMLAAAQDAVAEDLAVMGWLDDARAGRIPDDYMQHMGWVRIALVNAFAALTAGAARGLRVYG